MVQSLCFYLELWALEALGRDQLRKARPGLTYPTPSGTAGIAGMGTPTIHNAASNSQSDGDGVSKVALLINPDNGAS